MTTGAPGVVAKDLFPTSDGSLVQAAPRSARRTKAQLILEKRPQLRRHQVRALRNEQPDPWIAEIALAAHLTNSHVAVPIGDRTIGGERLESHPTQAVDRRYHDGQRWTVERDDVRTVEGVMPRIIFAWAPCSEFRFRGLVQRRRQCDDGADIQVRVGPAVQSFSDARSERIDHG